MLFDITTYNQSVLILTFVTVLMALLFIFRNKYISIIDPIILHLVWLSSHVAFLFAYIYKYGVSLLPLFFVFNIILYAIAYKFFLKNNNSSTEISSSNFNLKKIKYMYLFLVLINLVSKYNFYLYILQNPNILSWFQYRFVEMQGRDPLLRILSTATQIYITYYAFILFAVINRWKAFVIISYFLILFFDVFAGGRSIMLNIIFNVGLCVYYFRDNFKESTIKKFSKRALMVTGIAVGTAILVSAFYNSDYTLLDGVGIMVNRFFAAGDGLEYYMNYNGISKISSGFVEYIYSVFGIYIKRFTHDNYKNIGFQLSELVLGDLSFTQGANYTFLLQVMVLGYKYFIIYVPLIGFITAKLRSVNFRNKKLYPLAFFLSATSFYVAVDMEFWVLNVISGILFFYLFIYPISKFTFNIT